MKVTFFGAAGEVTGSCSLLETDSYKILIDCGMFQGSAEMEAMNEKPFTFDPTILTHVFVTHAHLDHVGRLPLLAKEGYKGNFYATAPTIELAELVMRDALGIMIYDNQKFGRAILYNEQDINEVIGRFKKIEYGEPFSLGIINHDGEKRGEVLVVLRDVGHIFGSAFIEFNAEGKKVVFSGDVGNVNVPILRDTEQLPDGLDLLVCESTYGDRLHELQTSREEIIERAILDAVKDGGVLMIPSFALERTQELIYELNKLVDFKHKLNGIPIFLDSPLAIDAIKVYRKYPKYYDEKANNYFKNGDDIFNFKNLTTTYSREESMKINHTPGPKVIIAGAGMMNGGRILHHALRYLSDARNTILFIGYQSPGTLGRQIQDGYSPVEVLGERVQVKCNIKTIGALSAHGDKDKLMHWITSPHIRPKHVYLNHGDPPASQSLATDLRGAGLDVSVAESGLTVQV